MDELENQKDTEDTTFWNKHKKFFKGCFIVSFIPYVMILISGIFGAINGASFLSGTEYGLEGAGIAIFGTAMLLVISGILPVCLIYRFIYAIKCKMFFDVLFYEIFVIKYFLAIFELPILFIIGIIYQVCYCFRKYIKCKQKRFLILGLMISIYLIYISFSIISNLIIK